MKKSTSRHTVNTRALITLAVLSSFLVLIGSGLWLYLLPHSNAIAGLHTGFGALMALVVIWHLKGNWKPLKNYVNNRKLSAWRPSREVIGVGLIATVLATAGWQQLPPFETLYNWGAQWRSAQVAQPESTIEYRRLSKTLESHWLEGNLVELTLDLRAGTSSMYPQMAIWLEDGNGNYVQSLYATNSIARAHFPYHAAYQGNDAFIQFEQTQISFSPDTADARPRPQSLPVWNHKRGGQRGSEILDPNSLTENLDGYTGATKGGNFLLDTQLTLPEHFDVFLELNASFDWNDYYHRQRFPEDEIYTDDGYVGQPSLIYRAEVTLSKAGQWQIEPLRLVGHGHHSGRDGKIYPELGNITSAKNMIDRALIEARLIEK